MGKPNRSLRTKGNTRPSSSGHSAELLSTAGLPPSPHVFIGFQNYQGDTSGQKQIEVSKEDVHKGCPEPFSRTILKKMLKRDAITRVKALQEFIDIGFKDNNSLKCVLPYWPRLFNKLALDPDKHVRELIHIANEQLVLKVKRDIAPYLKSFMGIWLITQCDPHAPAASAAQSAFSSAFPPQKQSEALMFCRSEIVKLIRENLFSLQPEHSSEPNALTEDECAEKYQLILTCTLSGIKLFVSILSQDDRGKILDDVVVILDEQSFWNYSKSKAFQVRTAWYRLVSTLCHYMPAVFLNTKCKLILSVMGSLSTIDPRVVPAIWECALQITTSFEDWWRHIDVLRQVLLPVWEFLKLGAMGNAGSIFPCLLPFLSKLPQEVITGTGINFYKEFFSCIRESSVSHSSSNMPSECNAIVKAFLECFQYSVDSMFRKPECDENLVEHLITEQLIPLVKSSFEPQGSHVAASSFYPLLGKYLQYIEGHALKERNLDKVAHYNNFLTVFWKEVYSELRNTLNMEHAQHGKELATLAHFFHSLHQPSKYISKKKVKFAVESVDSAVNKIDTTSPDTVSCQNASASPECLFLFENTVKICGFLCLKLEDSLCPCCIELFSEIISAVHSSKLFFDLLTVLHVPVQEITDAPCAFFQVVLKWAKRSCFDEISLDSIAEIIHSICYCVSMESALDLLDICAKVEFQKLFCRLVLKALDSKGNKLYSKWFQTPAFSIALKVVMIRLVKQLSIAKMNISWPQISIYRKTILKCISEASSEEPRISRKNIDAIMGICFASLSSSIYITNENLGVYTFLDLLCDICETLTQCSMEKRICRRLDSFVFRLFILSLDYEQYNLSEKQQKQLCDVWQASIRNLAHGEMELNKNSFLLLASNHLHKLLQVPLSNEMRSHVEMIIFDFLVEVEESFCDKFVEPSGCSVLSLMIEKILPSFDEWKDLKEGLNLNTVPSILKGKWACPLMSEDCSPICPIVLPQLIVRAEIVSHVLYKILSVDLRGKPDELFRNQLVKNFPHLLWSWCYIESMGYCRIQTEKELPVVHNLRKNIKKLASLLQACDIRELTSNLFDLSLSDGLTWAIPFENLKKLESPLFHYEIETCFGLLTKRIQKITVLSESLTMQVCLRNAPCQLSIEFLESVPDEFFDVENFAPGDQDYLGALSDVSSCIQGLQIQGLLDSQEKILCILHHLVNYHRLFGSDEEHDLLFVINFAAISSVVLREVPNILTCDLWCSIFSIVIAWFKRCSEIGDKVLNNTPALIFMHQTCTLICIISHLFREKEPHEEVEEYYLLPVNAEWHQLFKDVISSGLLELYLQISEIVAKNSNQLSEAVEMLMNVLSQAIEYLSTCQLMRKLLSLQSEGPIVIEADILYDHVHKLLRQLTPFLMSKSLSLQFGIHSILSRIVVLIPDVEVSRNKADGDADENSFKSFPLDEALQCTSSLVETMLAEVKLGEYYILEPYTNSYTYTMAYLLRWAELLEYFSASSSEKRCVWDSFIEENQLLPSLLMNLIRLLPENPAFCSEHIPPKSTVKRHEFGCIFKDPPPISSLDTPSHCHLQHVACNLYYNTLKKFPALVRTWWSNLDKKSADIVEKFTSKRISGLLSSMEICAIQTGSMKFNNMTVKVRPSSREVLATYAIDDSTIELLIQLPSNYPLGPIVADCRKQMGIGQAQWRNWLLQITTFLNYHNGSIVDALDIWKRNLDKKFEGVEECMICYFILHSSSYKLPSVSCPTCRKKFHSSCLYKWFSTSNNSTCPSCRNYF